MNVTRKGNRFQIPLEHVTHVYIYGGVEFKLEQVSSSVGYVEVVVKDYHDWSIHDEFKGLHVRLAGVHNEISGVVTGTVLQLGGDHRGNFDLSKEMPTPKPLLATVKVPRGSGVEVGYLTKRSKR